MKNCTPLQREAHFQVKMYKKNSCFGALLGIELSKKCTPLSIVARAGGERDRETQSLSHRSVHQLARSAMRRNNSPLLCRCPIFETSATALCGTNYWNAHWVGGRPMISQPCLERDRLRDLDLELRGIFPRRRSLLVADR